MVSLVGLGKNPVLKNDGVKVNSDEDSNPILMIIHGKMPKSWQPVTTKQLVGSVNHNPQGQEI